MVARLLTFTKEPLKKAENRDPPQVNSMCPIIDSFIPPLSSRLNPHLLPCLF